jgi:hypothetical protein
MARTDVISPLSSTSATRIVRMSTFAPWPRHIENTQGVPTPKHSHVYDRTLTAWQSNSINLPIKFLRFI